MKNEARILALAILGIVFFLSLQALMSGCAVASLPDDEIPRFENYGELYVWMHDNIRYVPDEGEAWNQPETTMRNGFGDCEDKAILWLFLVFHSFGIKGEFVVQTGDYGSSLWHAYAMADGHVFGEMPTGHDVIAYSYDVAMAMAIVF